MNRYRHTLVTLLQISVLSAQQSHQTRVGVLTPVPLYPKDGQLASNQANQYVFLDSVNHDLVLSYSSSSLTNGQEERTKTLIHLDNQFEPSVTVKFSRDSAGLISYRYTIQSDIQSKDRISFFSLRTPRTPSLALEPALTETAIATSNQRESAPSNWATPSVVNSEDSGRVVAWSVGLAGKSIGPGESYSGFSLSSQLLEPGFVMAQFSSGTQPQSLESSAPQDIPDAVRNELRRLDSMQFQFKLALTLGPKYGLQDSNISRVADFYTGTKMLIQAGHLKQSSPFVTELLSVLKGYLDGVSQSPSMPIENFQGNPLHFKSSPSNWLESQILEAMKISVGATGA